MVVTDINEKRRYRTVFRWLSDNVELIGQLKLQSRSNSLPKCVWTRGSYTTQSNPFVLQVGKEALRRKVSLKRPVIDSNIMKCG